MFPRGTAPPCAFDSRHRVEWEYSVGMVADTMKRFLLICPLLLTWPLPPTRRATSVSWMLVRRLCLTYQEPCPVVVTLSNPFPKPQDFELQIGVRPKEGPGEADPEHTYIHRLTLDALEERQIEAILPSSSYGDPVLEVTARIHQGVLTGHDWQSYRNGWPRAPASALCVMTNLSVKRSSLRFS